MDQFKAFDGVARIDVSQRKEMLDILKIIAETIILLGGWRIGYGAAGYLYSPIFILFYLVPWGITSNTTIQLLWGNVGQTEDVGPGWNSFAFP